MQALRCLIALILLANTVLTFAQDKKVLVVSANDPSDDAIIQKIVDQVEAIEGVTAIHMLSGNYMTITDFTVYDAALLTENGSSSSMTNLADQGWPIPVVNLKAYSLYRSNYPLFTQVSEINWYATFKSSDLLTGINWLIVKDNHDIFAGYQVGDIIQWTTGYNTTIGYGAGEAHIQAFDLLNPSYSPSAVVESSTPLASNKYLVDNALPVQNFMWKTEENSYTKRVVSWGIHHDFLEYATDDFYKILKNAVKWVLKIQQPAYLQSLTVDHGFLYPAFNSNTLKYRLAVDAGVDSILISARSISETDTISGTGYFNNIPGIANLRVISSSGDTNIYTIEVSNHTEIPKLSGLTVSGAALNPLFDPDTNIYSAKVNPDSSWVLIDAVSMDGDANMTGTGVFNTIPGTAILTITSTWGIVNHYSIQFTHKSRASLSSLTLGNGTLYPSFAPEIYTYRFSVAEKPDSILIAAISIDPEAVIQDTGFFSSIPGEAVVSVISEDNLITEYTIEIFYSTGNACLASLSASVGNLEPAFDPVILNYNLAVPDQINSVLITAIAEEENAKVSGGGIISNLPGIYTVVVMAEDSTILEYHINIFKKYDILVVSANLPAHDAIIQKFIDNINAIESLTAVYMNINDYLFVTDFTAYDAALITENGGSSSMTMLADMGWPIPVVNLKAYSLFKGTYPLFMLSDSTFGNTAKTSDLLPDIDRMIVEDNNDIFSGYQVGDIIQWTTGYNTTIGTGAGEAFVQTFDLFKSHVIDIAENSTPLASNKHMADNSYPLRHFMWKTEENNYTKRVVSWGLHHDFLENATPEFYAILNNTLKWVLNANNESTPYLEDISTPQGTIFPPFQPHISSYTLVVKEVTDTVTFIANKLNAEDTVTGDLIYTNIPGNATIKAINPTGGEFNYTIHVVGENMIAKLRSINYSTGNLFPAFDPEILNYTIMVPEGTNSITISGLANKPDAIVAGGGQISPIPGKASIFVVSPTGIVITYRITIDFVSAISTKTYDLIQTELYPVPFEERLTIKTLSGARVSITNIVGQTVFNGISNIDGELVVNAMNFKKGMYIFTISGDDKIVFMKAIKQ